MLSVVTVVLCACGAKSGNDGGTGGAGGGHLASGGGSAAGGGASAGGGSATGGGSAGGGSASGGGSGSFNIEFSATCPAFTPCPGALSGNYTYTGICVDLNNPFPGVSAACSGLVFQDLAGTAQGTVSFTGTDVTRGLSAHITGSVEVPEGCATSGCPIIQQTLRSSFGAATCITTGDAGQTCGCTFTYDYATSGTSPYSIAGNTLTVNPGTSNSRTYDFCVNGNALTYQETGNMPLEPGTSTLSK
jgi:hypothetical protein